MRLDFLQVPLEIFNVFVCLLFVWASSIRAIAFKVSFIIFLDSDLLISQLEHKGLNLRRACLSVCIIVYLGLELRRTLFANKHCKI